jgi:uncharacterized membrane protein YhaH (DUF805 family)
MFCPECGAELEEDANFCRHCGYDLAKEKQETKKLVGNGRYIDEEGLQSSGRGSTHIIEEFIELVKSTATWSGRFDRRQYAIVYFGMVLIGMGFLLGIALLVDIMPVVESGVFIELLLMMFLLTWCVVSVIVSVGAGVRRFHDLDLSGWYCLLLFIPLISVFAFLYVVFKSGKEVGETRWG